MLGHNIMSRFRNNNRLLKLRRSSAINRQRSPPIIMLDAGAVDGLVEHGLDGEHHAGHHHAGVVVAVVQDVGRHVEVLADAVASEGCVLKRDMREYGEYFERQNREKSSMIGNLNIIISDERQYHNSALHVAHSKLTRHDAVVVLFRDLLHLVADAVELHARRANGDGVLHGGSGEGMMDGILDEMKWNRQAHECLHDGASASMRHEKRM